MEAPAFMSEHSSSTLLGGWTPRAFTTVPICLSVSSATVLGYKPGECWLDRSAAHGSHLLPT